MEKPNVYWDGGIDKWVYRASALGNCLGALVRERMGETPQLPPDWLQAKFEQGQALEHAILHHKQVARAKWEMLDQYAIWDSDAQVDQETGQLVVEVAVGSTAIVRCHPDGIAQNQLWKPNTGHIKFRVAEAKALSPDYFRVVERELPPFYAWQVSVEMAGTGLGALYLLGRKTEDGDGLEDVVIKPIDIPPFTPAQIKARVLRVERLAKNGDVPDCEYRQYPCGFYRSHTATGVWAKAEGEELEGDEGKRVNYWAVKYDNARDKAKKYEDDKAQARTELLGLVGGRDNPHVVAGGFVVKVTKTEKEIPDVKKMKEDGVWDKYKVKSTSTRVDVNRKRQAEDAEQQGTKDK